MGPDSLPGRFGLDTSVISRIHGVLAGCPTIREVILYGSRAKGTYRPGSDIDLTIRGPGFTQAHLLRLAQELDDLLLPYTFDLSLFSEIEDPALRAHIERIGQVFYP